MEIQSIYIPTISSVEKEEICQIKNNESIYPFCDENLPTMPDLVSASTYASTNVTTSDNDDDEKSDSSSVSSLSSADVNIGDDDLSNTSEEENEEEERERSPRSIFKNYWNKNDETPTTLTPSTVSDKKNKLPPLPTPPREWGLQNSNEPRSAIISSNEIRNNDEKFTYERMLMEQEGRGACATSSTSSGTSAALKRRAIFGFQSTPTLVNKQLSLPSRDLRKASSTTELLHHRRETNLVSCLRRSKNCSSKLNLAQQSPRRSGGDHHNHNNNSVSFSSKVSVLEYDKQQPKLLRNNWNDQHSTEGWSKWFH